MYYYDLKLIISSIFINIKYINFLQLLYLTNEYASLAAKSIQVLFKYQDDQFLLNTVKTLGKRKWRMVSNKLNKNNKNLKSTPNMCKERYI